MFFLYALLSTLAYSLQNVLMARIYRRMDALTSVALRGLGLGITMLPLLFIAPVDAGMLREVYPLIAGASLVTILGNWASAATFNYLPIGVSVALNMSLAAVFTVYWSALILGDLLSPVQMFWMVLVLLGVFGLGAAKADGKNLPQFSVKKGVLTSLLFGVLLSLGWTLTGKASRQIEPFWAGYLWEVTAGFWGLVLVALRKAAKRDRAFVIPFKELPTLLLYTVPTAVGTGLFSIAVSSGPVPVVTAVLSTAMVFSSIFARMISGEALHLRQWGWIIFVGLMVVGLKICS